MLLGGEGSGPVAALVVSSQGRPGTIQGLEGSADFLVRGGVLLGADSVRDGAGLDQELRGSRDCTAPEPQPGL